MKIASGSPITLLFLFDNAASPRRKRELADEAARKDRWDTAHSCPIILLVILSILPCFTSTVIEYLGSHLSKNTKHLHGFFIKKKTLAWFFIIIIFFLHLVLFCFVGKLNFKWDCFFVFSDKAKYV